MSIDEINKRITDELDFNQNKPFLCGPFSCESNCYYMDSQWLPSIAYEKEKERYKDLAQTWADKYDLYILIKYYFDTRDCTYCIRLCYAKNNTPNKIEKLRSIIAKPRSFVVHNEIGVFEPDVAKKYFG